MKDKENLGWATSSCTEGNYIAICEMRQGRRLIKIISDFN